jgi:TolA-binding protein
LSAARLRHQVRFTEYSTNCHQLLTNGGLGWLFANHELRAESVLFTRFCLLSKTFISQEIKTMKRIMAVVLSMALGGSVIAQAQQGTATPTTAKSARKKTVAKTSGPTVSAQLSEMKLAIDAQQQQIKQLSDLVQSRDQKIQQLEQRLDQSQTAATQAQTKADTAAAQTAEQGQTVTALKSDVTDLKTSATNAALTLQETQKSMKEMESPLAIHYKGIAITPGGFLAGESYYRNRATGGEATAFNSIFMPGSGANRVSEFYGSGRQSQITLRADGNIGYAKLTGYYEADFLSAGTTSNNNQTNSYALRQRQAWGLISFNNGWSFTGGQMWTLLTENRKGIDNLTTARPMTIDPNYNVGFSFARQYGVRLVKNFNNRLALGVSLENPQTSFTVTNAANNFAMGSDGVGGGLYNPGITACTTSLNSAGAPVTVCTNAANYTFNAMPDIIVKAAADPGFGHYEIFGIFSRFRDRVYPCEEIPTGGNPLCGSTTSVLGAHNDSRNAGGVGGNARISVMHKHVDLGLHALYGNGLGRYAASGLPDVTVRPDGTLAPLRSYQGLATLEFHYPKLDVYFNGGEDYSGRRYQTDPISGKVVGYGSPTYSDTGCYTETLPAAAGSPGWNFGSVGSCSGQTQSVVEGTFGFWIKPYNGPKGRLQFGPQYSYVSRNAWAGGTLKPHAIDNMIFTSFRYYLP